MASSFSFRPTTAMLITILIMFVSITPVVRSSSSYDYDGNNDDGNVVEDRQLFNLIASASNFEVFDLIESFVRLKGEVFVKLRRLFSENYVIIKEFLRVLIENFDKLNDFTLTGIKVFRKIFEFAFTILKQWSIPSGIDTIKKPLITSAVAKPIGINLGNLVSGNKLINQLNSLTNLNESYRDDADEEIGGSIGNDRNDDALIDQLLSEYDY